MNDKKNVSRREFVKTTTVGAAAAFAAPSILTSTVFAEEKAAAPLRLGFIGIGKMGKSHLTRFLGYRDVIVTAVSDVDTTRREGAKTLIDEKYEEFERQGVQPCKSYKDYRDLLADKDIDAVLIATPDHWHTKISIEACKAKKDIYCEKPLTLTIDEAKAIID